MGNGPNMMCRMPISIVPPSSSENFLIVVALAAMRRFPIVVEPMVVRSRGIGELQSGASSAMPVPLTTLTTPAGIPVPSINWHAKLVASGVT